MVWWDNLCSYEASVWKRRMILSVRDSSYWLTNSSLAVFIFSALIYTISWYYASYGFNVRLFDHAICLLVALSLQLIHLEYNNNVIALCAFPVVLSCIILPQITCTLHVSFAWTNIYLYFRVPKVCLFQYNCEYAIECTSWLGQKILVVNDSLCDNKFVT